MKPIFSDCGRVATLDNATHHALDGEPTTAFKMRVWALCKEPEQPISHKPHTRPAPAAHMDHIFEQEVMTIKDIAEILGIHRESVRQIERRAILKCKAWLDRKQLSQSDLI
jgi:predicted XRE-type DNA-binding protein